MKSKKAIIITIIIIILLLTGGIILFIINKNNEENIKFDTSYKIITDYNSFSTDNKLISYFNNFNFGKIFKPSGVFSGLFEIGNDDIYKITVNTKNFLFLKDTRENSSTFIMIDSNNNEISLNFSINDGTEEISDTDDNKYTYNNWAYSKDKYIYWFNKEKKSPVCIYMYFIDSIKQMSEESFISFSKTLIDCIQIEYQGKKNAQNNTTYLNILSPVDIGNIKLSDNITLKLYGNVSIEYIRNENNDYSMYEHSILAKTLENLSRDEIYGLSVLDKPSYIIREMKDYDIEKYFETNSSYVKHTLNYKGTLFYIAESENNFIEMLFEIDGIIYTIHYNKKGNFKEITEHILQNIVICNQ